jgi:transposase
MSYSLDLRERVIEFVENGGSVLRASKLYKVSRATIYRWLGRETLQAKVVKRRKRKLDWEALRKDVEEHPDTKLKDRAKKFGVRASALCYAFKEMRITRKKKKLRYRERNREERIGYDRILRELIKQYGSESLVYIDESGFEEMQTCLYAWAKKGKRVYGEREGKRGKRENLVAGRRKKKKDLIAPMVFKGSLDAAGFEGWLSLFLIPSLTIPSVLIMDNAPIHRKAKIRELVEEAGHTVLFLPKYSPDLNDIEHDFSALKRARMYAKPETSLDEIIRSYCAT